MTDTTTRLLQLWKRFPETRPDGAGSWASIYIDSPNAHAIAGWRLLERLARSGMNPSLDFNNQGKWVVCLEGSCHDSTDGPFVGDDPLDALISAYWQAKGEQEPSDA